MSQHVVSECDRVLTALAWAVCLGAPRSALLYFGACLVAILPPPSPADSLGRLPGRLGRQRGPDAILSVPRGICASNCQRVTVRCHRPSCCPKSMAASRARSSGDSSSRAAASASTVPAFAVPSPLVQPAVQRSAVLAISPLPISLVSDPPLLDTLGVTGSSPVAPTDRRPSTP